MEELDNKVTEETSEMFELLENELGRGDLSSFNFFGSDLFFTPPANPANVPQPISSNSRVPQKYPSILRKIIQLVVIADLAKVESDGIVKNKYSAGIKGTLIQHRNELFSMINDKDFNAAQMRDDKRILLEKKLLEKIPSQQTKLEVRITDDGKEFLRLVRDYLNFQETKNDIELNKIDGKIKDKFSSNFWNNNVSQHINTSPEVRSKLIAELNRLSPMLDAEKEPGLDNSINDPAKELTDEQKQLMSKLDKLREKIEQLEKKISTCRSSKDKRLKLQDGKGYTSLLWLQQSAACKQIILLEEEKGGLLEEESKILTQLSELSNNQENLARLTK